jgi:branched-chain amino acid transport system ATP-binding protein
VTSPISADENRPSEFGQPAGPGQGSLEARDITVRFGGLTAVASVSLRVDTGEVVGLIGPNGAGKTTLVNALTGFQMPTTGSVVADKVDITRLSAQRRARRGIARTFQGSRFFSGLTVMENVAVSGVGRGLRRRVAEQRAAQALASVGLESVAQRPATDLTTGQEQRLQMARAIAMEPRYLFLDEPAAGLNETESGHLRDVIRELPSHIGCGVVLIEHDMAVIMGVCDRIIVLDNGTVIAEGEPEQIRRDQKVIDAYLGS